MKYLSDIFGNIDFYKSELETIPIHDGTMIYVIEDILEYKFGEYDEYFDWRFDHFDFIKEDKIIIKIYHSQRDEIVEIISSTSLSDMMVEINKFLEKFKETLYSINFHAV